MAYIHSTNWKIIRGLSSSLIHTKPGTASALTMGWGIDTRNSQTDTWLSKDEAGKTKCHWNWHGELGRYLKLCHKPQNADNKRV